MGGSRALPGSMTSLLGLSQCSPCAIWWCICMSLHPLFCSSTISSCWGFWGQGSRCFSLPCSACCVLPVTVAATYQITLTLLLLLKFFPLFFFLSGFKNTIVKVRKLWRHETNFRHGTSKCSFCFLGVMFANSRVSLACNWYCWKLWQAEFACLLSRQLW